MSFFSINCSCEYALVLVCCLFFVSVRIALLIHKTEPYQLARDKYKYSAKHTGTVNTRSTLPSYTSVLAFRPHRNAAAMAGKRSRVHELTAVPHRLAAKICGQVPEKCVYSLSRRPHVIAATACAGVPVDRYQRFPPRGTGADLGGPALLRRLRLPPLHLHGKPT